MSDNHNLIRSIEVDFCPKNRNENEDCVTKQYPFNYDAKLPLQQRQKVMATNVQHISKQIKITAKQFNKPMDWIDVSFCTKNVGCGGDVWGYKHHDFVIKEFSKNFSCQSLKKCKPIMMTAHDYIELRYE